MEKEKKDLEQFAFWNEALKGKEYHLEKEDKALYEMRVQKCGVCGSSVIAR